MRGLYIAPVDKENKIYGGVYKKILFQIEAFRNLGINMDFIGIEGDKINFIDNDIKFKYDYLRHQMFFKYIIDYKDEIEDKYDFVYIRFSFCNFYMFKLASMLKKKGITIFVEIPTYPYEDEIENTVKNRIMKTIDRLLWKTQNKYISYLVLTTDKKELFNINAISIFNGISSKNVRYKRFETDKRNINLVGVANVSSWHGYDRVINGIAEYNKNSPLIEVNFYIVGDGEEIPNLIQLIKKLQIEKYVHILGAKFGDELDEIYDNSDIGISSLALFRAGGGHDPIKSKEYISKGIPVVIGYDDRALSEELDFVYKVSGDEIAIDIEEIVNKYVNMKTTSYEIMQYAVENLTWESQIKKVVKYIK